MKKLLSFLILFLVPFFAFTQVPNPVYFNTASNSTATGTLSIGSNDLNWTVSNTGSVGVYVSAISCANQAPCCWMSSSLSNVNWITYPHTCSASPAEHSCLGAVDEFYKLSFVLPASTQCGVPISQTNAYCLVMDIYADNCVWEVFVNGVSGFLSSVSNPYFYPGHMAGNQTSVSLCNNWQAGNNEVIVHVKSGAASFPTWTGLMAIVNTTLSSSPASYSVPVVNAASSTSLLCSGQSASLTATGATNYTWNPGSYIGSTYSVSPTVSTVYTVSGTGSNSCVGTSTVLLTVADCTGISKTGNTSSKILVYPNPSSESINISGIEELVSIEIFNSLGSSIYSGSSYNADEKIDISEFSRGIYFIKIIDKKSIITKKIIKE